VTDLHARLRKLELALLQSGEGNEFNIEAAAEAVEQLEQLSTLRRHGVLALDSNVALQLGLVLSAVMYVLRVALELEQRGSARERCTHVNYDQSPGFSFGMRCTRPVDHTGAHYYGSLLPRQCEARASRRCRQLAGHDGEHLFDDDDSDEGTPT
jgi:hypothetical protein